MSALTIVLAGTRRAAEDHCRVDLGLNPRARDVVIVTGEHSLRGLHLRPEDRVLCCRTWSDARHAYEVMGLLRFMAACAGLDLADLWKDLC